MIFKKVKGRGYSISYQCYITERDGSTSRIARIDEPHHKELRMYAPYWSVLFVGHSANGNASNLLKITNKIKKLAKEYRDND